jgi:RNA polymerase sigma factor for flagellar operon FliA
MRAAKDVLNERHQAVIVLLYGRGLTMREAGEILGVEESRICQMKKFALAQLRVRLEQLGVRGVKDALR